MIAVAEAKTVVKFELGAQMQLSIDNNQRRWHRRFCGMDGPRQACIGAWYASSMQALIPGQLQH